ncbi:MAG: GNAT family N-acetyltransferase [Rhodovibrionaceae bacterium]|nr:GNAT family N-acetyltransferase [Rhodovibrionaceae bacterium]
METIAASLTTQPAHRADASDDRHEDRLFAILTLAFATDPVCRWLFPDPARYLRHFPAVARAFGGAALHAGSALSNDTGAALWLPPGVEPDEEMLIGTIERGVAESERAGAFALFEAMATYHPHEPHWYLPMIGVEPASQGQGHGETLMKPVLAECDASGLPAYLEATSSRSSRLYARLGFEAVGVIQVNNCPPLIPMLRRPRG